MSRDRLAALKAERDRARGVGQQPGSPPQQQQQGQLGSPTFSAPQGQQAAYNEPSNYAQQGQGAGYAAPPQAGRGGQAAAGYAGQQPALYPVGGVQQQQGYGGAQGQMPMGGPGQDQYEMQQVGAGAGSEFGNGAPPLGPQSSMTDFFAEIENISQSLQQLKSNIGQINQLHTTVLNSATNEERQEQAQQELSRLTTETSRMTNAIKLRIKNLSELNDRQPNVPGKEGERNTRRMQVAVQKKKFMDLIQEYREVEAKSREKHRARMERQYKIVKPDATQEEIRYAMDTDQGSQVFANALTQSTRYADARNAYREVQERHADIQRIAETMTELQQIFNDLAALVERQDEQIQTIEASAQDVETNMQAGNQQIEKGVKSARKARKKRIICFWIIVLIIIALALGITLGVLSKQGKI